MNEPAGPYFARGILAPEVLHAAGLVAIHAGQHSTDPATGEKRTGVGVSAVTDALRELAKTALAPDAGTEAIERTLLASAALLGNLAVSWSVNAVESGDDPAMLELYARLALKAQDQQRQTLKTLAEIRQPRHATFIRQQNQAVHEQVVNKSSLAVLVKMVEAASELLEELPHERLDSRTESTASGGDSALATVGAQYRPENRGRQSQEPL